MRCACVSISVGHDVLVASSWGKKKTVAALLIYCSHWELGKGCVAYLHVIETIVEVELAEGAGVPDQWCGLR